MIERELQRLRCFGQGKTMRNQQARAFPVASKEGHRLAKDTGTVARPQNRQFFAGKLNRWQGNITRGDPDNDDPTGAGNEFHGLANNRWDAGGLNNNCRSLTIGPGPHNHLDIFGAGIDHQVSAQVPRQFQATVTFLHLLVGVPGAPICLRVFEKQLQVGTRRSPSGNARVYR